MRVFGLRLLVALISAFSCDVPSYSNAQTKKPPATDPLVLAETITLLRTLTYAPGSRTDHIDKDTSNALELFKKVEQPPELIGLQGTFEEHLPSFRDAMRKAVEDVRQAQNRPVIFVETPHGRGGEKLTVDALGR